MDPQELFDSCDTDNSGDISLDELRVIIERLNDNMQIKEKAVIKSFFKQYDTNNDGTLSRNEFNMIMKQAQRQVNQKKVQEAMAPEGDEFEEDFDDAADEGIFTDAFDTVKGWFGGKKGDKQEKNVASQDDSAVNMIVERLSKGGVSF